ncbi:MAG: carbon-nitrogen hydrolase family protein [Ignavibacteriae bacterium]|nr:carbon-nitrogen hydrolase family protein [Ignavibacteriota bacterium]
MKDVSPNTGPSNGRRVRIASAAFLLDDAVSGVEQRLERCTAYAADAATAGADVLCFPEAVISAGLDPAHEERAGGPVFTHFSALALRHEMHIIAPFLTREGKTLYSRATLFQRDGGIAGCYDKVQPNGHELHTITPGDTLPVFELDFGRVAVMLCMDIHFPEIARIYALKGAEILFWPTMTHGPTQESLLVQARARALDNSLCLVEANYAGAPPYAPYAGRHLPGNARIIDHNGDILAQSGRRHGLAIADVNLDEIRLTSQCVLLREPDHMREDLLSLYRRELYIRELQGIGGS